MSVDLANGNRYDVVCDKEGQLEIIRHYYIVFTKFDQHQELAQKLLETDDTYLEEENTWGDQFWGTVNGKGANYLGYILMETRETLKNCF